MVKHFILPVLEDRNGALNTYILRTIVCTGGLKALLGTYSIVFSILYDSIKNAEAKKALLHGDTASTVVSPDMEVLTLDAAGNCAAFAMMPFLTLFRKLSAKNAVQGRLSTSLAGMKDDYGNFDAEKISLQLLNDIASRILPVFTCKLLTPMPSTVHSDWLLLAGEIVLTSNAALKARDEANAATLPQHWHIEKQLW